MNVQERMDLVLNNAEEVLTKEQLAKLLEEKKHPGVYIGMAPTGPYHMAYLVPLGKLFELQKAGFKTTILIANVHAAMDDLKSPWEELDLRAKYYEKCIGLGFPWEEKPKFVNGNEFQFSKDYQFDLYKSATLSTVKRTQRAASEVCRLKNPKVSELMYPIMQALDEEYLKVDMQLGGIDQRHIFAYARELHPKLGYKPRVELMTPLVASLKGPGTKMSASIPETHIKVYDPEKTIVKRMNSAYCPEGDVKENAVLQFCQFLIFPIKGKLKIERPEKFGGDLEFDSYAELERTFVDKKLHPADLKPGVAKELIKIFKPARQYFEKHADMLKELGPSFMCQ